MRAGSQTRTPLWLSGVAMAGVVFAHVAAYFIAAPDGHSRALLLHSSGDRYWAVVVALALGALVASLVCVTVRATQAPRDRSPGTRPLFIFTVRRLVLLQVSGFVLLEAFERLPFGADLGRVFLEPVLLIGIALQVLSAVVLAGFLVLFARTLERLCSPSTRPRFGGDPRFRLATSIFPPRFLVATGGATPRGPPIEL